MTNPLQDTSPAAGRTILNLFLSTSLAGALLVAGCAGSGGSRPASEPSLSVAAEEQAEKHSEKANGRLRAEGRAEAVRIEPWSFAGYEGVVLHTPNFRIHTTIDREDFVEALPAFYELAMHAYTTALGELPQPSQPLETYLFADRRQWQAKTRQVLPGQSDMFQTLGRGGFTTGGKAVLYYIDHRRSRSSRDTFAIAAHEGWHQYTQTTFRNQLPIWLEEGVATYMESFSLARDGSPRFRPGANIERRYALYDAARNDRLIPLAELLERSPQSFLETGRNRLLTYYAQVWALTRFLAEGKDGAYRAALEQVLRDAADGRLTDRLIAASDITSPRRRSAAARSRSGPRIILEYFNDDLEAFEREYLEFIDEVADHRRRW